jgi:pSer/pThr/pTyr-binding forkhead associated (FHA) protein
MLARIIFTAIDGGLQHKQFALTQRGRYVVGRAEDCDICLFGDLPGVSRHHCVLSVETPTVSVRDLGSCNGTFVNGELIGRRAKSEPADESGFEDAFLDFELNDGDLLRLGHLVLRVEICDPKDVPEPAYSMRGLL